MIDLRILTGDALQATLEDVAQLRISVFRDWPYLYDGDIDYERGYLQNYRDSAAAILVGASVSKETFGKSLDAVSAAYPDGELAGCAKANICLLSSN